MGTAADSIAHLVGIGVQGGNDAFNEASKNVSAQQQDKLKALLQGQQQELGMQRAKQMMKDLGERKPGSHYTVGVTPEGASISEQEMNPYHMMGNQAHQFDQKAAGIYKPINDQLSSSRATIEMLNQHNGAADKMALINEARLAAAGSGSRALGHIMMALTGDKAMETDVSKVMNYLNSTNSNPTMTEGQRDALRETVFGRIPQLDTQHQQAQAQLQSLGPNLAPLANHTAISASYTQPAGMNLDFIKSQAQQYAQARQGLGGPVSKPSVAAPNPSTLDRLASFFGKGKAATSTEQPQESPIAAPVGGTPQAALAGQPGPSQVPVQGTQMPKGAVRMQKHKTSGAIRYLDAQGNEVPSGQ